MKRCLIFTMFKTFVSWLNLGLQLFFSSTKLPIHICPTQVSLSNLVLVK